MLLIFKPVMSNCYDSVVNNQLWKENVLLPKGTIFLRLKYINSSMNNCKCPNIYPFWTTFTSPGQNKVTHVTYSPNCPTPTTVHMRVHTYISKPQISCKKTSPSLSNCFSYCIFLISLSLCMNSFLLYSFYRIWEMKQWGMIKIIHVFKQY